MDIQTQTMEMMCNCSFYRAYTKLSDDVTSIIERTNADLVRGVKKSFVFWHVFFLIMHGLLLCTAFMLYHSAVVKDICPPVNVCASCAPTPVCAPCPPVPVYEPCATVEAWQVHITPNTSEPTCDVCPSNECVPVVQCPPKDNKHYDNCATLMWAEAGY
jgi:hypothetical protein